MPFAGKGNGGICGCKNGEEDGGGRATYATLLSGVEQGFKESRNGKVMERLYSLRHYTGANMGIRSSRPYWAAIFARGDALQAKHERLAILREDP